MAVLPSHAASEDAAIKRTGQSPRVTVIIPVFNAERYVRQAIDSILAQTFADFELFIFDDGSTDRSREILRSYALHDSRIALTCEEHRGLIPWLNAGVESARGELIARMDADDIALPGRFARQVAYLDAHPECVAVGTRVLLIDPDGDPLAPTNPPLGHEEIDALHLKGGDGGANICHPSVMMRRAAILQVGAYDKRYLDAEDIDLFLRLAESGGKLVNLPEVLMHYRMHPNCVGATRFDSQMRGIARAAEDACRRRGLEVPDQLYEKLAARRRTADMPRWFIAIATHNGYWRTARKHALRELRRRPWSIQAWKLALHMSFGWFPSASFD